MKQSVTEYWNSFGLVDIKTTCEFDSELKGLKEREEKVYFWGSLKIVKYWVTVAGEVPKTSKTTTIPTKKAWKKDRRQILEVEKAKRIQKYRLQIETQGTIVPDMLDVSYASELQMMHGRQKKMETLKQYV